MEKKKKCRFDWTNYLNGMLGNEDKDIFISSTKDVQKPSYKKKNRKKKLNVTCELLFFEICPGKNLDRLCWLRRQWGWKFRKKYELKIKNLKIVQWNYIILK